METNHNVFDVIVVGGGAAGIAAACAARDLGKKVALFEKAPYLGGKATAAYVGTICGAYFRSEKTTGAYVCEGWPQTFINDLAILSNTKPNREKEGIQYLPYDQFQFKRLAEERCLQAGVELFLQSTLMEIKIAKNTIKSASVYVNDHIEEYTTKSLIDCTGEAIVANLIELEKISSDKYQASAKVFGLVNIKAGIELQNLKLTLFKSVKKGILENKIDKRLQHISVVPGSYKNNAVYLKIGLPTIVDGQLNQMTTLNIESRKLINEVFNYLKTVTPIFQEAILSNIPSEVGVRTGPRHMGHYILQKEDVILARKDKLSIARGAWPIEYWDYGHKPQMEYFKEDDYFDIPYTCLKSKSISNLYFAGRNISADNQAIASCRVIGTCLQTGYAAGILSFFGNDNISEAVYHIQKHLKIGNEHS